MKPTQQGDPSRELDAWHMQRALELAAQGRGRVEPNPLVGCVIARGAEIIGEGYHRRYGGPHAEIEALQTAGNRAAGSTLYVTLEPCCHQGKTPPCTKAVIRAGIRRVVAAMEDPFPQVAGGGAAELREAGVEVEIGLHEAAARKLNAPYLKLLSTGRPWTIGKWAMTLDGKLSSIKGDSRWISGEASRAVVHEIRRRVDAVMVAAGTARADDPLLTARPAGPRKALRIVVDDRASLDLGSQLVKTAGDVPVLVAAAADAPPENVERLRAAGVEVLALGAADREARLGDLFDELGRRKLTNVLVEGGAGLLGACFDGGHLDEVHVFIAPKLVGGATAPSPVGGRGLAGMTSAMRLEDIQRRPVGDDLYLSGRIVR
jgi:diaminohydroxyphosphoribosylaminopyrimidine deaminase / 5-amino-6-(5-phosphoribosylamino)uracil reductase